LSFSKQVFTAECQRVKSSKQRTGFSAIPLLNTLPHGQVEIVGNNNENIYRKLNFNSQKIKLNSYDFWAQNYLRNKNVNKMSVF